MKNNVGRVSGWSGFLLSALLCLSLPGWGMTLLTQEEALKQVMPEAEKITAEKKTLTAPQLAQVRQRLEKSAEHFLKSPKSTGALGDKAEFEFLLGVKAGQKVGVAFIDQQPGKWGPVQFIVALDPGTGKVKNLAVMAYSEKRGRPIATRNFLDQFVGKGAADPIQTSQDIRAVTGATISSQATCMAVQKAVVLYEVLYLPKH